MIVSDRSFRVHAQSMAIAEASEQRYLVINVLESMSIRLNLVAILSMSSTRSDNAMKCFGKFRNAFVACAIAATLAIPLIPTVQAQIPTGAQPWPGPPGSYRGVVRFLVFTVFGNQQHSTGMCYIDGAFVSLQGVIPLFGQAPYGQMAVLRSHPNYNEMIATLIAAKLSGTAVDIQLIKNPNAANNNSFPPLYATTSSDCYQIPIVGALGLPE